MRLPRRGHDTVISAALLVVGGAVDDQTQNLKTTQNLQETP